jgi:beta-lactamase class A
MSVYYSGQSPRYYFLSEKIRQFFIAFFVTYFVFAGFGLVVGAKVFGMVEVEPPQRAVSEEVYATPAVLASGSNTAAPVAPSVNTYNALEPAVLDWIASQKGSEWSVAIQDLDNPNNSLFIDSDKQYYTASLYKLLITLPLVQKAPFENWQLRTLSSAGNQTYDKCVNRMLALSDNPCGEAVGFFVGWSRAEKSLKNAGLTRTALATSDLRTTAGDMSKFLEGLANGKWFNQQTKEFILNSMANGKYRSGIPAGCEGCRVYNKIGDLKGYLHDAAIVEDGTSRYVLVVLSKGGSYKQIADLTHIISSQL